MNWRGTFLTLAERMVRTPAATSGENGSGDPRILVIRRNRMGDMICTLPLLHALRRHHPRAHLAVACDPPGAPIAAASGVVDDVLVLEAKGLRMRTLLRNARRLQGFDLVLAAKGGFDRRVATLARLSGAARRIGFEPHPEQPSLYYTDPVAPPATYGEHQVETLLRLLEPLGVARSADLAGLPELEIPASALAFAAALFDAAPWNRFPRPVLINISSTARLKLGPDDFPTLARRFLAANAECAVIFVAAPADQPRVRELAARCASERVGAVATPGPLELAAVMKRAALLVTPEGGAAHLAAAVRLPAVVLWSEGPFEKWHSRARDHVFVRTKLGEGTIHPEAVWEAVESLLGPGAKKS